MVEWRPYALYPVRIALAIIFFTYALDKAIQYDANIRWFDGWGVPWPAVAVPVVMAVEFAGGLALFLGIGTRTASVALAAVLLGAMVTAKAGLGVLGGIDLEIAMLGGLVALAINGPGRPTLTSILAEWKARAQAPSSPGA